MLHGRGKPCGDGVLTRVPQSFVRQESKVRRDSRNSPSFGGRGVILKEHTDWE
jgi:hypothetical protein